MALTLARKPYRMGILFTHRNSDFGEDSLTERSYATTILKVICHISDGFLCHCRFVAVVLKPYQKQRRYERGLLPMETEVK